MSRNTLHGLWRADSHCSGRHLRSQQGLTAGSSAPIATLQVEFKTEPTATPWFLPSSAGVRAISVSLMVAVLVRLLAQGHAGIILGARLARCLIESASCMASRSVLLLSTVDACPQTCGGHDTREALLSAGLGRPIRMPSCVDLPEASHLGA